MPRARRLRRRWPLVVLPIVIALVLLDRRGLLLLGTGDEMHAYHGRTGRVVRVIDGDTFEIDLADRRARTRTTRLRLWGIDCPEAGAAGGPAEPHAGEATRFTAGLVEPGPVTLWLEPQRMRDQWGRVLVHADLPGGICVNESLLAEGLARVDERWPHQRLDRYDDAAARARAAGRGIWSSRAAAARDE